MLDAHGTRTTLDGCLDLSLLQAEDPPERLLDGHLLRSSDYCQAAQQTGTFTLTTYKVWTKRRVLTSA